MLRKIHIILLFLLIAGASCSEYEKLLKSTDPYLKYDKGLEYYEAGKYVKAATVFEQILPVFRGTDKAESLNFYHAMCYYKVKDYILAGHYFRTFFRTYPNSQFRQEAEFLAAYSDYLLSPRPSLDQSSTYAAIEALRFYIRRYPESDKVEQAGKLIKELEDKLVQKSFNSAKLYFDLGYYNSAVIALTNSLNEYPDTRYREELMFLLLKSKYLLAANSIAEKQQDRYQNAVDEYYSFISEFPKSKFLREAEKIFLDARGHLRDQTKDFSGEITDKR